MDEQSIQKIISKMNGIKWEFDSKSMSNLESARTNIESKLNALNEAIANAGTVAVSNESFAKEEKIKISQVAGKEYIKPEIVKSMIDRDLYFMCLIYNKTSKASLDKRQDAGEFFDRIATIYGIIYAYVKGRIGKEFLKTSKKYGNEDLIFDVDKSNKKFISAFNKSYKYMKDLYNYLKSTDEWKHIAVPKPDNSVNLYSLGKNIIFGINSKIDKVAKSIKIDSCRGDSITLYDLFKDGLKKDSRYCDDEYIKEVGKSVSEGNEKKQSELTKWLENSMTEFFNQISEVCKGGWCGPWCYKIISFDMEHYFNPLSLNGYNTNNTDNLTEQVESFEAIRELINEHLNKVLFCLDNPDLKVLEETIINKHSAMLGSEHRGEGRKLYDSLCDIDYDDVWRKTIEDFEKKYPHFFKLADECNYTRDEFEKRVKEIIDEGKRKQEEEEKLRQRNMYGYF